MTTLRGVLAVACLAAALPAPLAAQGPFIDWINKMSGPQLQTYGVTFRFPDNRPGKVFGYNPGQRLEEGELAILLQAASLLRGANADAALNCALSAYERFSPRDAAFHEAGVDSWRAQLRGALADALVRQTRTAQAEAQIEAIRNLTCGLSNAELASDPGWGIRFRGRATFGRDRQNPDRTETKIHVLSPQLTAELLFGIGGEHRQYFGIESGIAGWYWFGEGVESFFSTSVPVFLNYHPFARCSSWLLRNFRLGGGVHIFSDIDEGRFGEGVFPEEVGGEVIWTFFASLDISRSALQSAPRLGCGP